jgi:predicted HTH domain antitoxin
MMSLLREKEIPLNYSEKDLEKDLEILGEAFK